MKNFRAKNTSLMLAIALACASTAVRSEDHFTIADRVATVLFGLAGYAFGWWSRRPPAAPSGQLPQ